MKMKSAKSRRGSIGAVVRALASTTAPQMSRGSAPSLRSRGPTGAVSAPPDATRASRSEGCIESASTCAHRRITLKGATQLRRAASAWRWRPGVGFCGFAIAPEFHSKLAEGVQ